MRSLLQRIPAVLHASPAQGPPQQCAVIDLQTPRNLFGDDDWLDLFTEQRPQEHHVENLRHDFLHLVVSYEQCMPGIKSSESTRGTKWLFLDASNRARRLANFCLYRLKSCGFTSGSSPGGKGGTTRERSVSARQADMTQHACLLHR